MLLEVTIGGVGFLAFSAFISRCDPDLLPTVRNGARRLLPSKTLKGSPEDLDPSEVAVNLAVARMLRNISAVEITGDSLSYSDSKINKLRFHTYRYFSGDGRISGTFVLSIKAGKNSIDITGPYHWS